MSKPRIPQKSNGGKGKYEVVTEAEFNHKVSGGTRFNGFIVYPNETYGFAVPLQEYDTIRISTNSGFVIPKQNHFVFKPIQESTLLERLARQQEVDPISRNPKDYENQRVVNSGLTYILSYIPNTGTIKSIFVESGGKKEFDRNFMKFMRGEYVKTDSIIGTSSMGKYVSDSQTVAKANETNQWVNKYGVFYANNITETVYDAELTNFILGCMIYGVGPENIVFPTDGTISSTLKNAGIVNDALEVFYEKNRGKDSNLISISQEFSGNIYNLGSLVIQKAFHPETFLGSANVKVQQKNEKQLLVEIFNITSLTSGDFIKHFELFNSYPMSVVRDQLGDEHKNAFGNVSQTYRFTIDIDFKRLGTAPSSLDKGIRKIKDVIKYDELKDKLGL